MAVSRRLSRRYGRRPLSLPLSTHDGKLGPVTSQGAVRLPGSDPILHYPHGTSRRSTDVSPAKIIPVSLCSPRRAADHVTPGTSRGITPSVISGVIRGIARRATRPVTPTAICLAADLSTAHSILSTAPQTMDQGLRTVTSLMSLQAMARIIPGTIYEAALPVTSRTTW
jgi:hypothetical protein